MSRVAVVTDSVASIPEVLIESLGIHWVPYHVHAEHESWRDLVTIQREPFYRWLSSTKVLPKTACPSPGDYARLYESLSAEKGIDGIVSIHMTSKGSGAYQAAKVAQAMTQERLPDLRLKVIDTLNVSMCQGWMVIEAARAALEGASLSEVADRVKRMIPSTRMIKTADTLKYLYMGGRIGRAKHLVGTVLNIKPLIGMEDGVIVALGQARSRRRTYEMMVRRIENVVGRSGKVRIACVHAAARAEAEKLKDLVEAQLNCTESIIAELSPALGVHTGPGTAGVCYAPVLPGD